MRTDRRNGSAPTPQRTQLLAGLSGRVLEIGAGDGVKLTCYPAEVEEIVLVEADPFLRAAAKGIAGRLATPVQILDGDVRALPVPGGSCDAVVCSLVLCCAKARDAAAVMSAMHAGTIVLHPYLSRRMGVDVLAREHATAIGAAMAEVYAAMGEFARSEAGRHLTEENGDE